MYNLKGALFVFFIMIFPTAAFGGKAEPNDDCFNICDGMCRMCIMFCEFTAEEGGEFGACIKQCAELRFSCRMFCEVDYEGESTGAFFAPNQGLGEAKKYLASSSKEERIINYTQIAQKRIKRREAYKGCQRFCAMVDVQCFFVCHFANSAKSRSWLKKFQKRPVVSCFALCGAELIDCHKQCRSLYEDDGPIVP